MAGRDHHVIEALGRTRVVIEDGKVVEIGTPMVRYCPLFMRHRSIKEFNEGTIRENIEFRIEDFGMCTPRRKLRMRDFLSFGVSELMGMCVSEGIIDCAVLVCDGAGTVVLDDPELIQGIGGRISGIVETSPIEEVIAAIGEQRVLDPAAATIDQVEGAAKAAEMGYGRIGVTITLPEEAVEIRRRHDKGAVIFAVHTTGIDRQGAERLFDSCDIITSCASLHLREVAVERALMSVGSRIPIYAASPIGKKILERRLAQIGARPSSAEEDSPSPLV